MITVELRFGTLVVVPERRYVETRFANGRVAPATRDLDDEENRRTAADLGYANSAVGVWQALVAHELYHSLISDWVWMRASRVLLHAAGVIEVPYYERIHEEAIVLAFQRYMQTNGMPEALAPYARKLNQWRSVAFDRTAQAFGVVQ